MVAFGVIISACFAASLAMAATEAEKAEALGKGLAYLYKTQQSEGYWSVPGTGQATTGAAVFAFLSQRDKWGDNAARYQAAVEKAMAYIVSTANVTNVTSRTDGVNICPGGTAPCKGIYWFGDGQSTRATGLITPAIAAYARIAGPAAIATSSGPLAGMTWEQIAQGITNTLAASQSTRAAGNRTGGWGPYIPGGSSSDSASTYWAVVSLLYAETLRAVTPNAVKAELRGWLDAVQSASGAACQQPGVEPCTHADTGGWLLAMRFLGIDNTNPGIQAALAFLSTSWQSPANNASSGNFGNPSAMWAVYEGLGTTVGLSDTTHVTNSLTRCRGPAKVTDEQTSRTATAACTWSEDYIEWTVRNVTADGNEDDSRLWKDPLTAAFYVNILGSTRIPLMSEQLPRSGAPDHKSLVTQELLNLNSTTAGVQASSPATSLTGSQAGTLAAVSTRLRPRVRKGVTALAITGDGSALATAGTDRRVRVWTAATGLQRLTLPAAVTIATGLAFTPDGNTLTTAGRDTLVRLWDAVSGSERAKLAGHEHPIRALAVSANGALLATAGEESRVMVWDQAARKLSRILYGSTNFVNGLSFSPDSRLLATAGEDARVLVFDVAPGKLLYTLRGHAGPIDTVSFSPDGTLLASAGQDTVIRLWNPVQGQQVQALRGHSQPVRTITFSPDSRMLATGGEDTQIRLWNTQTGALQKVLSGSTGLINVLIFDPKGRFLVSASDAGELILWNVVTGTKLLTLVVP
jgi:WD40 repeat protein